MSIFLDLHTYYHSGMHHLTSSLLSQLFYNSDESESPAVSAAVGLHFATFAGIKPTHPDADVLSPEAGVELKKKRFERNWFGMKDRDKLLTSERNSKK